MEKGRVNIAMQLLSFTQKRQLQRLVIEQNKILSSDAPEADKARAQAVKDDALAKLLPAVTTNALKSHAI